MRHVLIPMLMIPAVTLAAEPEKAEGEKGFIAALAGPALVTSEGGGNHFSFGIRAGLTVNQDERVLSSLGVAYSSMSESATVSGVDVKATTSFLGLEYISRKAFGSGFYYGARGGLGLYSATVSNGVDTERLSDTVFAYAPVIGYELGLGKANAVFDLAWMNIGGGEVNGIEYDRTAAVTLHAGIGLNF